MRAASPAGPCSSAAAFLEPEQNKQDVITASICGPDVSTQVKQHIDQTEWKLEMLNFLLLQANIKVKATKTQFVTSW